MANTLLLKKSGSTGESPTSSELTHGELAINYADGKLFFKNSGNSVVEFLSSPGTGAGQVLFSNGSTFTGDSNFLYDDTNNRLGIGTATPASFLHVESGNARQILAVRAGPGELAAFTESEGAMDADHDAYILVGGYRHSNNDINISPLQLGYRNESTRVGYLKLNGGTDAIVLDASGNTTFGGEIDLPQYIRHTGDTDTHIQFQPDRITFRAGNLEFVDFGEWTGGDWLTLGGTTDLDVNIRGGSGTITIQGSDGYIGINDTTPSYPLDIVGNTNIGGTLNLSGNATFAGNVRATSDGNSMSVGASNDLFLTHSGSHSFIENSTGELRIVQSSGDHFSIWTDPTGSGSDTKRFNIAPTGEATFTGNVGIGPSPHAFHTDRTGVAIGGTGVIENTTTAGAGNFLKIAQNTYYNGSVDKTIVEDESSYYVQESGQHKFYTAPSHATTATLTERFKIANDGKVAIGYTGTRYNTLSVQGHSQIFGGSLLLDAGQYIGHSSSEYLIIPKDGNSKMIFKTATVQALELDSSQNATFAGSITATSSTWSGAMSVNEQLKVRWNATSGVRFPLWVNRQNSATAALYLGNDASSNAVIASNASDLLLGRDVGGTFTEALKLDSSSNATFAGNLIASTGDATFKNTFHETNNLAKAFRGTVSGVDETAWYMGVHVNGYLGGSAIRMTIKGSSTNHLHMHTVDIICAHYQDIYVKSFSGPYTVLHLKIESGYNEDYNIYFKSSTGSVSPAEAVDLIVTIEPLTGKRSAGSAEWITFTTTPTTYSPTRELIHSCYAGYHQSAVDGTLTNQAHMRVDGNMSIGTSDLTDTLHVKNETGSGDAAVYIHVSDSNNTGADAKLRLGNYQRTAGVGLASEKFVISYGAALATDNDDARRFDFNIDNAATILQGTAPSLTLMNTTQENNDGFRESWVDFRGEKADGTKHTLARIMSSQQGSSDNYDGILYFKTNTTSSGADTLVETMRLDSDSNATFAGEVKLNNATGGKLRFEDGSGNNSAYIEYQESAESMVFSGSPATVQMSFAPDGNNVLVLEDDLSATFSGDVSIAPTKKLYFDGAGGNTYITETQEDYVSHYVKGLLAIRLDEVARVGIGGTGNPYYARVNIPYASNGSIWCAGSAGGTHSGLESIHRSSLGGGRPTIGAQGSEPGLEMYHDTTDQEAVMGTRINGGASPILRFYYAGGDLVFGTIPDATANGVQTAVFTLGEDGNSAFTGNVSIGSPNWNAAKRFHVTATGNSAGLFERYTTGQAPGIGDPLNVLYRTSHLSPSDGMGSAIGMLISDGNNNTTYPQGFIAGSKAGAMNTSDMVFWTYNAGSGSEKMRIKAGGNVGIGTTNPNTKFIVNGGAAESSCIFTRTGNGDHNIMLNTDRVANNRNQILFNCATNGYNGGYGESGQTTYAGISTKVTEIVSSTVLKGQMSFYVNTGVAPFITTVLTLDETLNAKFANHILPDGDNDADLGSSSKRWANIYVGDMHLKNDRGDWTVIEEEEYLSLKNNKNGKTYKLVMEEV